jgi:hypothetical protein
MKLKNTVIIIIVLTFSFSLFSAEKILIFQPQKKVFTGTINNKIKIHMTLEFSSNSIKGTYFYDKQKKDIELKGNLNEKNILLEEFSNGAKTGVFAGIIEEGIKFSGKWSTPDGKKVLPFLLEEISNDLKGNEISGNYTDGDNFIDILLIDGNKIKFQGEAFWQGAVEGNIHIGEVMGIVDLKDGKALYKDENGNTLTIILNKNGLTLTENPIGSFGGANVTFDGNYKKTDSDISNWDIFNGL